MARTTAAVLVVVVTAAAACAAAPPAPASRPPAPELADGAAPRPTIAATRTAPERGPKSPLAAAAAPATDAALRPPAPISGPHGELIRAGSRTVTTADLGDFVLRWQPDAARAALHRLTVEALVQSEAAREEVEPPAELLASLAESAFDDRVRRLRLEHGVRADVAALLRTEYGRTEAELRADLGRAVRIDLLRERLARLDVLRRDGVEVRVLVVPDERAARSAAAQWRDGADGASIARGLGVAAPDAPPAIFSEDVPDVRLRQRLTSAVPGSVLDPVPFEADDPAHPGSSETWWQVFKVVRSWKAATAPWRELAAGIEASLRDAPPGEAELALWDARAARRTGLSWWDGAKGFGPPAPGK